jgi:hypothetical protein
MNTEKWLQQIEEEFENQTKEDIDNLLIECLENVNDEVILDIAKNITIRGKISFKQWKALKAELSKIKNPNKSF